MSSFKHDVFGENGLLHRAFGEKYEVREQQMNMSVDCAKTMMSGDILLAEGATGVGKSFAYLIASVSPTLRELMSPNGSNVPIVISTSTKILQDQITEKDVPAILDATGQDLKVVLMKGRSNYISHRRMEEFVTDVDDLKIEFANQKSVEDAVRIAQKLPVWAEGSSGELSTFDETIPVEIKGYIESTDNDCQGRACKKYGVCSYYAMKRNLQEADIIIVNHALLATHIAFPNVLPTNCKTYIIDEAHKFYESVSNVFEAEIRLLQLERYFKRFRNRLKRFYELIHDVSSSHRSYMTDVLNDYEKTRRSDVHTATEFFEKAIKTVYQSALKGSVSEQGAKYGYAVTTPTLDADVEDLIDVLSKYTKTCQDIAKDLDIPLNGSEEEEGDMLDESEVRIQTHLSLLNKTAFRMRNKIITVTEQNDPFGYCYWSDVAMAKDDNVKSPYLLSLKSTPIDITQHIAPLFEDKNTVIFTSATLQTSNKFDAIKQQFGLSDIQRRVNERVYPSPFPFKENVEIHLFDNTIMDRPSPYSKDEVKEQYLTQQASLVEYYLRLRDGRALVLCSSSQMLHKLTEKLEYLSRDMDIELLKQYNTDRLRQTFREFKENERSVLFGLASCWEGLDAPGSTLETVIIPQLPFAPPHPVLESRKQLLDNPERDWFWQISLPDMLLQLKQGAGRLVRSMTDTGVITILSPRPLTKSYGNQIKKALPPGKIICNPVGAIEFMEGDNNYE